MLTPAGNPPEESVECEYLFAVVASMTASAYVGLAGQGTGKLGEGWSWSFLEKVFSRILSDFLTVQYRAGRQAGRGERWLGSYEQSLWALERGRPLNSRCQGTNMARRQQQ